MKNLLIADLIKIKWCLRNSNHRFEDFCTIRGLSLKKELSVGELQTLNKVYEKCRKVRRW